MREKRNYDNIKLDRIHSGDILFLTDLGALLKCTPRGAYDCLVDLGVEAVDLIENRAMFFVEDLRNALIRRREITNRNE